MNQIVRSSLLGRLGLVLAGLLFAGLPFIGRVTQADDDIEKRVHFEKHVAPVLATRCISCHNDVDKKGDFSLANLKSLLASETVVAGDPGGSSLLEAISGDEPQMPKNAEPLEADEVAAIRQWIESGANWPADFDLTRRTTADFDWWSFKPLTQPPIPKVLDAPGWVRNPIDAFVLTKQLEIGLTPAAPADRRTLIRRLTFDLTGLPATPEEVEQFVNDSAPKAYEHLVDRLLDSEHYGERWGRHWLDVVKYADTCGYDKDKLRPNAWPYRDYVIRSLNEDKPYARFVEEQLAGDVLYKNTSDGILGLGFIAAGPWDFIGHVEVPEAKLDGMVARHLDRDEMVSNTLNAFCSTTIQCARCHNHKFDPFTQEHYYSLQAVFSAVDRADRPYDVDSEVEEDRRRLVERRASLVKELADVERQIQEAGGEQLAKLDAEIKRLQPQIVPRGKRPEFGYHSQVVGQPNQEKWVQVDLGKQQSIESIELRPCHDDFGGIGAGFGFPVRFAIEASLDAETWTRVLDQTNEDLPNPGLRPIRAEVEKVQTRYIRVVATSLAKRSNDYIFALAELIANDDGGKNVALGASVTALDSIEAPTRWRKTNLTDGIWATAADEGALRAYNVATSAREKLVAKLETPERVAKRKSMQTEMGEVDKSLKRLPVGKMVYAAATDFAVQGNFKPTMGTPREVRVLHRGEISKKLAAVQPGVIPLSFDDHWQLEIGQREGDRRANLAKWITAKENPLTWRSIVNRVWLYHFGQGIVTTPNDFGRMGQLPSHGELLDWLAVEFRDGGQSLKQLHRLMVTSATYRQSSALHDRNIELDSGNQYLWRMNRRRLHAEEIRDASLSVSGALNRKMGGPGFYLFVLEKTAHSPHYEYHKFDPSDDASHRRSVYRFIVRSQPDPFMTTLDCADSSQSTPQRDETITALQALSLLNNRFSLTMSSRFADRLRGEQKTIDAQVQRAIELALSRKPSEDEHGLLVDHTKKHGLESTCRLIFNLSEFVYLD